MAHTYLHTPTHHPPNTTRGFPNRAGAARYDPRGISVMVTAASRPIDVLNVEGLLTRSAASAPIYLSAEGPFIFDP